MADDQATRYVHSLARGDRSVLDRLYPLVYAELRALAASFLAAERPDHTLQPTALVSESYVRLVDQSVVKVHDRKHFIAVAAGAMRHVLVDHARRRNAEKRGGGLARVEIDGAAPEQTELSARDVLDLHEALEVLSKIESLTVRVVELRYFGGLTIEEAAEALGISASSVEREWRFARAWLRDRLG
jgi:RNA polymerase sigma-70 factor (ECF subfamily)